MGSSSSKKTVPTPCPKCAETSCAPCPVCPKSERCVPYIIKALMPVLNGYLESIVDQPLGQVSGCEIGTLRNISLCNLVDFQVPTSNKSCDLQIIVHSVKGADHIHLSRFEYELIGGETGEEGEIHDTDSDSHSSHHHNNGDAHTDHHHTPHAHAHTTNTNNTNNAIHARVIADSEDDDEQNEILLQLGINFGELRAEVSTIPVKKNCKWVTQQLTNLVACDHKIATFGSVRKPAYLNVSILVPLNCKSAKDIKVENLEFQLGAFDFDCFRSLSWLPETWNAKLVTLLSTQITTFLRSFLGDLIQNAFDKFKAAAKTRVARPRYQRKPKTKTTTQRKAR